MTLFLNNHILQVLLTLQMLQKGQIYGLNPGVDQAGGYANKYLFFDSSQYMIWTEHTKYLVQPPTFYYLKTCKCSLR